MHINKVQQIYFVHVYDLQNSGLVKTLQSKVTGVRVVSLGSQQVTHVATSELTVPGEVAVKYNSQIAKIEPTAQSFMCA